MTDEAIVTLTTKTTAMITIKMKITMKMTNIKMKMTDESHGNSIRKASMK